MSGKYMPSLVQIAFLNSARTRKYVVKAFTRSTHEKIKGRITDFDDFSIVMKDTSEEQKPFVLFKNDLCVLACSDNVELPSQPFPFDKPPGSSVAHHHFLTHALEKKVPVSVELSNGEVYQGVISHLDTIVFVLHIGTQYFMIYKGALRKVEFATEEHHFKNREF